MRNRLLCTCPSRGRPELLERMVESFYKTRSENVDLVIYLDKDDPKLKEYKLREGFNVNTVIRDRMNVAQIHNQIVFDNPGYGFYMPINDDITFISNEWDAILIEAIEEKGAGWGIAFCDDSTGNHRHNLPTFGAMSVNIINAIGHLYPLELRILYGDNFMFDLGRAIGRLFYCPKAIVNHQPPGVANSAFVPGDRRLSPTLVKEDNLAYKKYIDTKLDSDVQKIFEAIINEKNLVGVK